MTDEKTIAKAQALRVLHDDFLVVPNAWDGMSAVVLAKAGAAAVATTSGGVAWGLGLPDGQQVTRDDMVAVVARVAAAVDVPVSADVEGGYGTAPQDVAATVRAIISAGAVGVNLEDSTAPGGPLHTADEQGERLAAARAAAHDTGLGNLVINARTDVFLFGIGAEDGRLDDVLARAVRYAEAGADCLFVPGLLDLDVLQRLTAESPLPVNAMAMPDGPDVAALRAVGVRRVTIGTVLAQVAYSAAERAAREFLESGTYASCADAASFMHINSLVTR